MEAVARRRRYYMAFARAHTRLLFLTNGRPAYLTLRLRCLLLETSGRRTGAQRKVALLYMPEDEGYVVIASNFGRERPPAWWLNLETTGEATVIISGRRIPVRARELQGDERTAVLARATAYNKQWRSYASSLDRVLPVVRLEPTGSGGT
jgi:F420H(2)-dependent quinone reductase